MFDERDDKEARDAAEESALLAALLFGAAVWTGSRFMIAGRAVSPSTVRTALRRLERISGRRAASLVERVMAGTMTVEEWRLEMRAVVGGSHLLAAALASGSLLAAKLSAKAVERVAAQKAYVDGFARDIERGKSSLAKAKARAKSYFVAVPVTAEAVGQDVKARAGFTEARRVRTAMESCAGCVSWGGRWMPIREIAPIGTLDCASRCRCYLEFR